MTNFVPRAVTAGTSLSFRRSDARYPASAGWKYSLAMRVVGYSPTEAVADGDDFVFTVSALDTAEWAPGTYSFSERVSLAGDIYELGTGRINVRPDLAVLKPGSDGRTHNERTLSMLEAAIEGRAVDGIESYSIAGRAVSKLSFPELVRMREKYRMYVKLERNGGRLGTVQIVFGGAK